MRPPGDFQADEERPHPLALSLLTRPGLVAQPGVLTRAARFRVSRGWHCRSQSARRTTGNDVVHRIETDAATAFKGRAPQTAAAPGRAGENEFAVFKPLFPVLSRALDCRGTPPHNRPQKKHRRPHRLVAQDIRFSAEEQGFDSPWGYSKNRRFHLKAAVFRWSSVGLPTVTGSDPSRNRIRYPVN